MKLESPRVGSFEVGDDQVLSFPHGLIGMPERTRFILMELGEGVPLGWLQSVDDPEFGLPVADPTVFRADYRVETSPAEVADLELDSVADAVVLIVTTVAEGGLQIAGNLRAPIVVNTNNRVGKQLALEGTDVDLRAEVDLSPLVADDANETVGQD